MEKLAVIFLVSLFSVVFLLMANYSLNKLAVRTHILKYKFVYHPNSICVFRVILAIFAMWIYYLGYEKLGIIVYIFSIFWDAIDGIVARKCNLVTDFGKMFDPFCDKITYLAPIFYFSYHNGYVPMNLFFLLAGVEISGQFIVRAILSRLKLSVAANNFGKIKAVLCFLLALYCFLLDGSANIPNFSTQLAMACIVLALSSIIFKFIPNWLYGDMLSGLNLVCGIIGCFMIFHKYFLFAAMFVMAGQVFDLFDGRMAQKHGGTKMGPWMDDFADFVSFGLCPALMVANIGEGSIFQYFLGAVFLFAIIYRLLRFVLKDKKRSDLPYGIFSGLPSPAGAAIILGTCLLWNNIFILSIIVLATSVLSVSKFRFAHIGSIIAKKIPRPVIIIFGSLLFSFIAFIVKIESNEFLGFFLLISSSLYIVLGKIFSNEYALEKI